MDDLVDLKESLKSVSEPNDKLSTVLTEFNLFSRLSVELRLKIWRATWTSKEIWQKACLVKEYDHHQYSQAYKDVRPGLPDGNLPVTAWVNQESREETLRVYRKIPGTDFWSFDSYFNMEIDSLRLFSCTRRICSTLTPSHLLGVQRLIIDSCFYWNWGGTFTDDDEWDDKWFRTSYCEHDQPEYITIGNLVHYFKTRYMPSLSYLRMQGHCIPFRIEDDGKELVREDMRDSLRPLFFRYKEGAGGLQIVPLITVEPDRYLFLEPDRWFIVKELDGFEILFLGSRKDEEQYEPAAKHRTWLEFISIILWTALKPEAFLDEDGINGYLIDRQEDYLL
ncbi:hypothetical protein PGQ11_013665 [Apiospora arundinis]|uniref:2EXR domain-containing protein n=1 Tax=Apiospora arundinis TaxID=335852 RepID=A0ABR2HQ24_9PEZI